MDQAIDTVLEEYRAREASERTLMRSLPPEEVWKRIDEFLISVGPDTARFMNTLIKAAGAKTIVELGASYGYSTIWLAEAARATGGKVMSCDVHAGKQAYARERLQRAGLLDFVEFKLGDARQTLAALAGQVDFVLIDLWKDLYIACFDLCYPKLKRGAYLIADNMLFPETTLKEAKAYREHVRAKPDLETVLLPIGSGIAVSRFGVD
jgi:predicted O-methyltransferase YrrM